ncbi:hypothetical protein DSECCO2_485260 [anaerobic digester metagenome]
MWIMFLRPKNMDVTTKTVWACIVTLRSGASGRTRGGRVRRNSIDYLWLELVCVDRNNPFFFGLFDDWHWELFPEFGNFSQIQGLEVAICRLTHLPTRVREHVVSDRGEGGWEGRAGNHRAKKNPLGRGFRVELFLALGRLLALFPELHALHGLAAVAGQGLGDQ